MPRNRIHTGSDGRWTYKISDSTGKRHVIKSRLNETKNNFIDRCDQLDKLAQGQIVKDTMNDLFYFWLENYVKIHNSKSDYINSKSLYELYIKPLIGHQRLHEITRADVYRILNKAVSSNKSTATIKRIRGCISRPFNWSINSMGYNLVAPTQGLVFKYPDEDKTITFLTESDINRFFESAKNSKHYNYFKILFLTGLRPSECLGLKNIDIKKDHLAINQGWTNHGYSKLKTTKAKRKFPLYPELKQYLHIQRTGSMQVGSEWLFPSTYGLPSMNAVQMAFKRILKQTAVYERGGRNGLKKLKLITKPLKCTMYDFRWKSRSRRATVAHE